jgi:hypothetical protein
MRFISTDPEFSWGGTSYILLIPTLIGICMGIVRSSPEPKLSRVFGFGSAVLLGMGGGIVLLPTVLLGSVAVAKSNWPWWPRVALGLLSAIPTAAVLLDDSLNGRLKATIAFVVYLGLCATMIKMVSFSLAKQVRPKAELRGKETCR